MNGRTPAQPCNRGAIAGIFFATVALRPASLQPDARLRLTQWAASFGRFFPQVWGAAQAMTRIPPVMAINLALRLAVSVAGALHPVLG